MARNTLLMPDPAPTLAVVVHDPLQRQTLLDMLRAHGLAAWGAADELALYRELAVRQAGVILVDVDLAHDQAFAILRHLAPAGRYVVMALAAPAQEEAAREAGALACVPRPADRPIDAQQMLYSIAMAWESSCPSTANAGGWWLNPDGPRLVAPDGRGMRLTTTEQRLVGGLMACYGQTLTKEQLISLLWGRHSEREYHGVEVLLSRLRSKALKELGQALPIKAVQAVGLVFYAQVTPNVP